ncbi:MAG: two-component system nitrogen regulation sensor histidine kinase NtrY [Algoriphagus sp.]
MTFLLTFLSTSLFERKTPKASEQHYGVAVQKKVSESLEKADKELTEVTGLFQKSQGTNFAELNLPSDYPYYIFKEGELIYWSDHRYIPKYEWIKDIYGDELLSENNHISLVKKQIFYYKKEKLELIALVPIYRKFRNENDYLKSSFDKDIFPTSPLNIEYNLSDRAYLNIHDEQKRFLFSVVPPRTENLHSPEVPFQVLWLLGLSLSFLGVYLLTITKILISKKRLELAAILILAFLLLSRWFLLSNSIPFAFNDSDIFNPKFFAINRFSPSLGDLILNTLLLTVFFSFIAYYLHKFSFYRALLRSKRFSKSFGSVLVIIASNGITYNTFKNLSALYENSSYLLELSFGTSFNSLKIATLLFFILLAVLFFLSQQILISIFLRLNRSKKSGLFHWVYGVLLSTFLLIYLGENWWLFLLISLYFFIVYYFKLPRYIYTFRYQTSIYFFLGAFVFSLLAVQIIRNETVKKSVFDKQNYGLRYLAENDALGEGLLTKVITSIQTDNSIHKGIKRERLAKEYVSNIIKENHLDLYFDKYKTDVLVFDSLGIQTDFSGNSMELSTLEEKYKIKRFKTENDNIFFINETGIQFIKQYVVFIPLAAKKGTVVLDLRLRDSFAESVYPELLMEKTFVQNPASKMYSYAIFDNKNKLLYTSGKFNYSKTISTSFFENPLLYERGLHLDDFDHLIVRGQNGRKIIISSENQFWESLLSDFSFLYLILVLVISVIIVSYAIRTGLWRLKMNFSTKIQIYLNAAFLIPFVLILLAIIGVTQHTLINIQGNFYLENTQNISSTVRLHLQNLKEGKSSEAFFEQQVNKLAQDTKSDINYFDLNGELVYSSRPLIYEYNLLSDRINPMAYQAIIEEKGNQILTNESLGKLNYTAVYLSIRDNQNERLGVIGIPFFDSTSTLEKQLKDVFTTILSICIVLFLILLVVSYFVSIQLSNPLKMVAQKIKKTSLNRENELIKWEADDEIGVLTSSYNNMVKMLEDSKDALSQSEKQSAWREMAKQVAHEIKNPLTPMKLSIQQLQRTLPSLDEKAQRRIERALSSLTEQIDNISEIANSFSEFAKMPVPRSEVFDLSSLVKKTAYLYAQNNKVDLSIDAEEKDLFVRSDHQLINRVVTNLIINGIQSVPFTRKPAIKVKVYRNDKEKFAIIEVKDNGNGIEDNVRQKVFMPNFSTKVGGSGLGLAMAKRGVEHSGGNIWFETEVEEGTTFYVDLPLASKPSK